MLHTFESKGLVGEEADFEEMGLFQTPISGEIVKDLDFFHGRWRSRRRRRRRRRLGSVWTGAAATVPAVLSLSSACCSASLLH